MDGSLHCCTVIYCCTSLRQICAKAVSSAEESDGICQDKEIIWQQVLLLALSPLCCRGDEIPSERLSGSSGMCERALPAISVPWWCLSISLFIIGFKQMVSFTFTYHTDEFKVFSECALLSIPSPWLTELIYDMICDDSLALFYISLSRGLVSGMIKSFAVTRLAAVLFYARPLRVMPFSPVQPTNWKQRFGLWNVTGIAAS